MQNKIRPALFLCLLLSLFGRAAAAASNDRYLHVKVEDPKNGESVNVSLPLAMAQKILPTINRGELHDGRVTISDASLNGVDVRALRDAIRTAPDNEFVTVKSNDSDVRVAKSNGNLIVHVRDKTNGDAKVDVTVPMKVVDALFSTAKNNELDVAAALRALSEAGDTLLVTVQDAAQQVRIWVDSRASGE
jgi:Zn-dependent alcohol dehydrogenase